MQNHEQFNLPAVERGNYNDLQMYLSPQKYKYMQFCNIVQYNLQVATAFEFCLDILSYLWTILTNPCTSKQEQQ